MSTYFDSRKNYLKQFMQGEVVIDKPATNDGTFFEYYTEHTINHNLGYVPLVRAWYDPENDGIKYPASGQKGVQISLWYTYFTAILQTDFIFCINEVTDTTVTFRALRNVGDGAMTGTFSFWYKIYLDPSLGVQT